MEQRNSILNSLRMAANNGKKEDNKNMGIPFEKLEDKKEEGFNNQPLDENIKFMDSTIYTVLLDHNGDIKDVMNHSNNEMSNDEISSLATSILENKNLETEHIGFLYFENYSYIYYKNNSLIILDNASTKNFLISSLEISVIVFLIFEMVIFWVSKLITTWITNPVKESFDKQKQFIADASHELKTPLSVIIASSDALESSPTEMKWLKNIRNEADRMNLLITDLLELSKSEQERIEPLELCNISKVVELAVLTFEGRAFEKKIKIDYQITEQIKMKMNENRIRQLVEILLDNAIEHSNEKETIFIQLMQIDNNIELIVKNRGTEIPKGEEDKIFERFYRIDKSRNRKDNRYGLGLAIAKNIVENHHGKISASSFHGTTTFKVLFKK